jgi:hypothetical protein
MLAVLAVWAGAFFLLVWALQWLWNMTMPQVFNLSRIRYWQSFRLMLIATILFGLTNVTIQGLFPDTRDPQLVVTGVVTDAATGQPIEGARVSDDQYGSKPYRGAVTGPSGTYVYRTSAEEHNVIARAPGYRAQRQTLITDFFQTDREKVIDFELQPE